MRYRIALIAACALTAVACSSDDLAAPSPDEPVLLELAHDRLGMYPGDTIHLNPAVLGSDGTRIPLEITWTVSDDAVVSVDAAGVVTAHEHGLATITVTADTLSVTVPVRVTEFTTVGKGAMVCALDVEGGLWCHSTNYGGVLGEQLYYRSMLPVAPDLAFDTFDVGPRHACGIAQGNAYCWGSNDAGQIGSGTASAAGSGVTLVAGGHTFESVSAGYAHTCAIEETGAAWCWGEGDSGQLGNGTLESSLGPVRVAGELTWRVIRAAGTTTCGIATDDRVYCWGYMGFGGSPVPALYFDETGASTLDIGGDVCAAFGAVVRCGSPYDEPVELHQPVRSLSAGAFSTCALVTGNTIHCWGQNYGGELGRRGVDFTEEPLPIDSPLAFRSLDGHSYAFAYGFGYCSVSMGGALYCWGDSPGMDYSDLPLQIEAPLP